jgi:hypothetical protein
MLRTPSMPEPTEKHYVELHPRNCACGGFAAEGPWDSARRPCDIGRGPAVGIVVDREAWKAIGEPRSEEAFREALAAVGVGATPGAIE